MSECPERAQRHRGIHEDIILEQVSLFLVLSGTNGMKQIQNSKMVQGCTE